jgi:hypothetical protein
MTTRGSTTRSDTLSSRRLELSTSKRAKSSTPCATKGANIGWDCQNATFLSEMSDIT